MASSHTPPLIVGNWKMHGTLAQGMQTLKGLRQKLLSEMIHSEIVLCPPFTLLRDFAEKIPGSGIRLGAQDCHEHSSGAFTGDISATMLRDLTCEYVILGHSERRKHHNESSVLIASKATAAHQAGLKTILCVGESLEAHEQNTAKTVVAEQLRETLPSTATAENTIIAYEPIWAIGSNRIPTLSEISAMHMTIQEISKSARGAELRVLYGGSVDAKNTHDILSIPSVSGLLVGRASLKAEDFWNIITTANTPLRSISTAS